MKKNRTIAVIPARGGSKGVPRKAKKILGNKPLISWTIDAAVKCELIDWIYVTTDDPEIKQIALDHDSDRVFVAERPTLLATDWVQTDEVLRYTLRQIGADLPESDVVRAVMLDPTCPFRTDQHISDAIRLHAAMGEGTVFAAYPDHRFHWKVGEHQMEPVFHDPAHRLGRQWIPKEDWLWQECGALYVIGLDKFLLLGNYRQPPFMPIPLDEADAIEIDTPVDWERAVMRAREIINETSNSLPLP